VLFEDSYLEGYHEVGMVLWGPDRLKNTASLCLRYVDSVIALAFKSSAVFQTCVGVHAFSILLYLIWCL
jgi:hypothetical protein